MPTTGGTPRRLTYHTGSDDVVGWTRDSAQVIFRTARGEGAFPTVATLYQISAKGGQEQSLNLDWGYWGSFSPDGKSLVFNRHPAVWSRRHYRGSYAADLWIADIAAKSYTKLLGDEQYNRYWPMWGADGSIYFVGDPLPNEKSVIPGSLEVRKSVNNIYKIPVKGGTPTQVTRHTDGSLFWPSMSSDGKVIVYEDNFGIWKLDVASGKTNEIKLDIASDEKENELEFETITNEVDTFDLSPSGRRAVVSARGQIFTIATERGDITRVAPDKMASRNQTPKWSADGKFLAFVSDRSGRDEIWVSDPEGRMPKKITDLDNEKGSLVWTPDSTALLYTAADKKLYSYNVADGKTAVVASSDVGRIGSVAPSRPTANGSRSPSRIARCARTSTSSRLRAARNATCPTTACSTRKPTPSGPPTAATSSSRLPKARTMASRRRAASVRRWSCGCCRCATRIAIRRIAISTTKRRGSQLKRQLVRTQAAAAAPPPRRHRRFASTGTAWRDGRVSSRCRERSSADSRRRPRVTRSR